MTENTGNGSDRSDEQPAPVRRRARRDEAARRSDSPAWMTGEIPRVSSDPEDSAATNVTPNIVRHVDASDSGAEATGPVDPGLPPAPAEEPVAEVDIDPGDATSDGAAPVAAEPGPPAVPDDEESVI